MLKWGFSPPLPLIAHHLPTSHILSGTGMGHLSHLLPLLFLFSMNVMIIIFSAAVEAEMMGGVGNNTGPTLPDCPPVTHCGKQEIRFPFKKKEQPSNCGGGYPGFDLSCRGKKLVLELSGSGEFLVEGIDYANQIIKLGDADPNGCLTRRLLDLNLSSFSPFQIPYEHCIYYSYDRSSCEYSLYYLGSEYIIENSTYLNCSTNVSSTSSTYSNNYYDYHPIPCLSGLGRYFYSTDSYNPGDSLPSTCKIVHAKLSIVWSAYPYPFTTSVDDNFFFLKWEWPNCNNCEAGGQDCRFNTTANATTCLPFPPHSKGAKRVIIGRAGAKRVIIGSSIAIFVVVIAVIVTFLNYYLRNPKRLKEKEELRKVERFIKDYKGITPTRYTFADIKRITNGFKNKLGQGGYGSVFKGMLLNEIEVAVKILEKSKGDGEEFMNEVATIGRIHHVNVVRLLGFCAEGLKRALIYEFMPNKSLEKFILLRGIGNPSLSWEQLYKIAIGTARGIEYLHGGCNKRILHFDIKPHNILLDHNCMPKISDFGFAKLCSKEESVVSMTAARGTMGYIAPEMFSRNFGAVSLKSDVYSFGMLLLEMVGGRDNMDHTTTENANRRNFTESIYRCLHQGRGIDVMVGTQEEEDIVKKLTIVALWCIQWNPADRPCMKRVVHMLEGGLDCLELPPEPFVSSDKPHTNIESSNPNSTME